MEGHQTHTMAVKAFVWKRVRDRYSVMGTVLTGACQDDTKPSTWQFTFPRSQRLTFKELDAKMQVTEDTGTVFKVWLFNWSSWVPEPCGDKTIILAMEEPVVFLRHADVKTCLGFGPLLERVYEEAFGKVGEIPRLVVQGLEGRTVVAMLWTQVCLRVIYGALVCSLNTSCSSVRTAPFQSNSPSPSTRKK